MGALRGRASKRGKRAGGKKSNYRRSRVRAQPVLTPLHQWERQRIKLSEWRARVESTPTMQGEGWRAGQLRHIDRLIAQHEANKPPQ